ncbi:hypothetical protein OsI_35646 [Oryza sativa Indica Group]|uniref:Uncharacterized protein n=1 Tax=Oryza sativa subsp. indica TaxID=39946 RepID=A2ZCY3_ORYSI|nr:hypothetical protein OsI_35646 [Oryza sativa Indica Group]
MAPWPASPPVGPVIEGAQPPLPLDDDFDRPDEVSPDAVVFLSTGRHCPSPCMTLRPRQGTCTGGKGAVRWVRVLVHEGVVAGVRR